MADVFSPKERLLRVLNKEGVERPPVICPGGMMNAAIVDVMRATGHTLPEAHHQGNLMEDLACDVHELTGFENFGVPFCMTIEPEALGSSIDYGSLQCEPKIKREKFPHVKDVVFEAKDAIGKNKRAGAVLGAIQELSKKHLDVPVIGSLTGPLSTAASLVDPMIFFKELIREKEDAHRVINYVTEQLIDWAILMADNGATVISIADPTATGEILGPRLFEEYALPALNRIVETLHKMGKPVILHICGDVRMVKKHLFALTGDALSVDAMVNLGALKNENTSLTTMGNLSTYLLESGSRNTVHHTAEILLGKGIDILAPACGLSTSTPLGNIIAFTSAVKEAVHA